MSKRIASTSIHYKVRKKPKTESSDPTKGKTKQKKEKPVTFAGYQEKRACVEHEIETKKQQQPTKSKPFPYCTPVTLTESKQYWLPAKSNVNLIDSELFDGDRTQLIAGSWYSSRVFQASNQWSMGKTPLIVSEQTDAKPSSRTSLIRLFPTSAQVKLFKEWERAARWTYNQCLAAWKEGKCKMHQVDYRNLCINATSEGVRQNPWLLKTPYDIRDAGMQDLIKAYKSTLALLEQGHVKKFDLRFRSKKEGPYSIEINAKHFLKNKLYPGTLREGTGYVCPRKKRKSKKQNKDTQSIEPAAKKRKLAPKKHGRDPAWIKSAQPLPSRLPSDSRLVATRDGLYYLSLIVPVVEKPVDKRVERAVAFDPGVRTFMTGYDPSGYIYEFGADDMSKVFPEGLRIDRLISRMSKVSCRVRQHMQLKLVRLRRQLKDKMRDLHCKVAKFLATNFTTIILPMFDSKGMSRRRGRKINSKVVRQMLTWSHYGFRKRLLDKVQEYPGCQVILCTEEYTSKQCGLCPRIHDKLGSSKTFKCPDCQVACDRDHHAARNVWLKWLTETSTVKGGRSERLRQGGLAPKSEPEGGD